MELNGHRGRITIHPLFFATGILSALTGGFLMFCAAVFAALEHECAHACVARRYGYRLDRVVLMPYGAAVSGDLAGIGRREELAVLLAGPLSNLATGLFFVALWWMFPETYPYTELAASVSFSLFFVNLLPARPLDGGRLLSMLLRPLGKKKARIAEGLFCLLVAGMVLGFFVWSCFSEPQWTALFFAGMLVFGTFGGGTYERIAFDPKRFLHGVEERRVAVDAALPVGNALRFVREDKYLTLLLFENGTFLAEVNEEDLLAAFSEGRYAEPLAALA